MIILGVVATDPTVVIMQGVIVGITFDAVWPETPVTAMKNAVQVVLS